MSWFSVFGWSNVFVISRVCSLSHWTNLEGLATQIAALPYSNRVRVLMLNSLMVVDGDGPWVEVDIDRSLRRR